MPIRKILRFLKKTSIKDKNSTTIRKVDFLVIGAQKAGTSALNHYLSQHPDIEMAAKKELHFFNSEKLFSKKNIDYNKYIKHFNDVYKKRLGESTPDYIYWPPCAKRIWEYRKDIKLIAILRNPIHRAFSNWNMELNRGNENQDFFYCITHEYERAKNVLPYQPKLTSYTDRGFYSEQIRRLKRFFYDDQLLFIKYENFKENQQEIYEKVINFLGLELKNIKLPTAQVFDTNYVRNMTYQEKKYLLNMFENDIHEVERLLNWDCNDWFKV